MIIALIIILSASVLIFANIMKASITKKIIVFINLILLLLAVILLIMNFYSHLGMKKVAYYKNSEIYSVNNKTPNGIMIAKEIGTESNNYVLIYKDSIKDNKPKVYGEPNKKNIIKSFNKINTYKYTNKNSVKGYVSTKIVKWEWKNNLYQALFSIGGLKNTLYKYTKTVKIPRKTWIVLTPKQAKELEKNQKNEPKNVIQQQQQGMQLLIKNKMQNYMKNNHNLSKKQIDDQTKIVTAEIINNSIKKQLNK